MRNASGRDGSNLPFSTALIELRETPTFSASSAWLQPFSALRTRMRFFMSRTGPSRHRLSVHQSVWTMIVPMVCNNTTAMKPSANAKTTTVPFTFIPESAANLLTMVVATS
jgi:hypothetical protein